MGTELDFVLTDLKQLVLGCVSKILGAIFNLINKINCFIIIFCAILCTQMSDDVIKRMGIAPKF